MPRIEVQPATAGEQPAVATLLELYSYDFSELTGTDVAVEATRAVFALFPGEWQVRQVERNVAATAFWRRAIPVAFTEDTNDEGPVQHFTIAP